MTAPNPLPGDPLQQALLAQRHAQLEAEVSVGQRDARSLVAIPAEMAQQAQVVFPVDAFGEPRDW
jgi:hypothetical protein